ncbi:NAD(P)-binding protein [Lindgomyces ingoldianus]|uniref:NAD(P)-binding protein n=1 Tax=Lindgomyces ingoldianus TaxID=673940 RepID=A0ACB6R865_9PLEO|nr:NAD(P)-binding protein [Lindgomyces ingoldianus]KAF2475504.1 NAD(P)-binding protein [Lindgomyces ingoldianus]
MAILVTGSTGKTSLRLAQLLKAAGVPYVLATRRAVSELPESFLTTKLDWFDKSTFSNPFKQAEISAVYLVPPETMEPAPHMNTFIDLAVQQYGVKKFVLCGGTSAQKGGMYVGKVWSHLEELGVEFAILRPTWFMENFSEWLHCDAIKSESTIYSAAEDGKIPFVSADDIAEAACAFLTGKAKMENKDYLILGPELLTHDQVALTLSNILNRPIKHVRKSQSEMVQQYLNVGVKELFANFLPYLEITAKEGSEASYENNFEKVTGKKPIDFRAWAEREAKKGSWN